jgi:hypothetical protein
MPKFFGVSCFAKVVGASFNIFTVGEKSKEVLSAFFSELQEKLSMEIRSIIVFFISFIATKVQRDTKLHIAFLGA